MNQMLLVHLAKESLLNKIIPIKINQIFKMCIRDRHNTVAPGNQHDSVVFHDAYRELLNTYGDSIHNISLDAGFITPAICREIIEDGICLLYTSRCV